MSGPCALPGAQLLGVRTFPADPAEVRSARRWLTTTLAAAIPEARDDLGEDGALLLSEAMTNAVRHSTGQVIEVVVHLRGHEVLVEVIDGGGGALPHRTDDPCGENGRGLPIMLALSSAWGYETLGDGRLKVWFTISGGRRPVE